jgi:hypothetical protein
VGSEIRKIHILRTKFGVWIENNAAVEMLLGPFQLRKTKYGKLRAVPIRSTVSLCMLGFIIELSDMSLYSISVIPIGINYVCLAEYCSDVTGSFSRELEPNVEMPALPAL